MNDIGSRAWYQVQFGTQRSYRELLMGPPYLDGGSPYCLDCGALMRWSLISDEYLCDDCADWRWR